MTNLATILQELGDLQDARSLQQKTLADCHRILGEDHPGTLTSMHSLAVTLQELGDLQGAQQLQERLLTARRRALGEDHPDTQRVRQRLTAIRGELMPD